jgi:mono/diheme cytochrome c family protein
MPSKVAYRALRQGDATLKPFVIVAALLFFMCPAWAQQSQTPPKSAAPAEYKVPPEAKSQVNPVKPTPESIARGKKRYGYDCAMCHGKNGDGKGDLAADSKAKVTDFTDPAALKGATDGELFYITKNGKGEMPPEGERVTTNEIWNLVNYIRSLAKKESSPEEKAPH